MASDMQTLQAALDYTPRELDFGTSGLRGLEADMTDLECFVNVAGFLRYLHEHAGLQPGSMINLAGDLRGSTPRIMQAVAAAIKSENHGMVCCGLIPTPAVALFGLEKNEPAIMVTGSHIPADRNGIKFYKPDGEVLKDDEQDIKKSVAKVRAEVYANDASRSPFDSNGMLKSAVPLPAIDSNAEQRFLNRYADIFTDRPLSGKHVIVYQQSAVGRDMLVKAFESLGAKVTSTLRSDVFLPIDTENVTTEDKLTFKQIAEKYADNFAIISTDGDSDRPFLVDEKGDFHSGDVLGAIVAEYLKADYAAVPISANDAVDEFCLQNGIEVSHTKIGSPYVIKSMQEASEEKKAIVGWEVNGGFLLGSDFDFGGIKLAALPTRDAFLPIIVALIVATQGGVAISDLFNKLPKRYTSAGLLDLDDVDDSKKITEIIKQRSEAAAIYLAELSNQAVAGFDTIDGLRVKLVNSDVIHIRPSGNAPQLRIYSTADSQERADQIVADALAPQGILTKFLNWL